MGTGTGAQFVDPRANPEPRAPRSTARLTAAAEELEELHRLCRLGRLYDIERWILAGRPLQLAAGSCADRRRQRTALEIALDRQDQALVLLLVANGYDLASEPECPLDSALRLRRGDLLDLLLEWGADPRRVDLDILFETYDSQLFERFRGLGVDLTAGHALAYALGYHTSNKPLLGFAKRHRLDEPRIQTALDIALAHHAVETGELDTMLYKVADIFDEEVSALTDGLMKLIEPLLICFLGGAVGFIVIALFMPLISLIQGLS